MLTRDVQARTREMLDASAAWLLEQREEDGVGWRGRLSSSALATAVAAFALRQVDSAGHGAVVASGVSWLAGHVNPDGGWGDTPDSPSNLSTTLLGWCACTCAGTGNERVANAASGAEAWLCRELGSTKPEQVLAAVLDRYGKDRTFSVPILTMCALAGRLGRGREAWLLVPRLPYALAALPPRLWRWCRLGVVSYALPALIAVGLVRARMTGKPDEGAAQARREKGRERRRDRWRRWLASRLLRRLRSLQPQHGGFLEAPPLTAFVAMCLAGAGYAEHDVVSRCCVYLVNEVRKDGSWAIDRDLATWVSALAVSALNPPASDLMQGRERQALQQHFVNLMTRRAHPYTGAAEGGWGWTDGAGSVPDADDTAAVLLALRALGPGEPAVQACGSMGVSWLLGMQNRDGGVPTFCRGWGRLPFDRSCPDLTAHALLALDAWYDDMGAVLRRRMDRAVAAGVAYLCDTQQDDGTWVPLWFGHQGVPDRTNPAFGTARVVQALQGMTPERLPPCDAAVEKGKVWLLKAQNPDGGWGGGHGTPSSVEETAVCLSALAWGPDSDAVARGLQWLDSATRGGTRFPAVPIGLYFARLWYAEALYPGIFTVRCLNDLMAACGRKESAGQKFRRRM